MKNLLLVFLLVMVSLFAFAEKVVITYVNWNLGLDIEKAIVEEFEKIHPNIEVKFAENIDYGKYIDSLSAAAAAGELPDVIMIPNIPMALTNDWAYNIKEFTENDLEWFNIPEPMRKAVEYGKGVYAVPAGMYFMGYFVNDDLFDRYNYTKLSFAPSWAQFYRAVKELTKPSDYVLGLSEEVQIPEWYPASVNKNFGWFTWDGEKYNLDSVEFIRAVNIAKNLFKSKYVFDALTPEEKQNYNAGWYGDVWNNGQLAIRWSGTWDINGFKELNFNSRFIGVPGGKTPVVGDFMIIAKSSKHPKEAYEFLRYITFAREGILKRLEIDKNGQWTSLPLTTEKGILNRYFSERPPYPGILEAYEKIDNGIIEGVKIVPGYIASRWTAPTGIKIGDNDNANIGDVIWNSMRGNINIADYVKQLNELANSEYQKAKKELEMLYK